MTTTSAGLPTAKPLVRQIEQPRRHVGQHPEAFAQLGRPIDLQHVGIEIGDADERAVAVGRRRIENVVGGERAAHAVL